MKLLRTIVIVPIFALATLTGAALPNVGVASASVGSLKYCVGTSQLNGSIMTLTTGDGPVYSYYLFIGRDGVGWEIAPWPPSFPLKFVAKGNLKIMVAKDEVRFEQVWPATVRRPVLGVTNVLWGTHFVQASCRHCLLAPTIYASSQLCELRSIAKPSAG